MLVEISLPAGLLRRRLQTLCVLGDGQLVDDLLDVAVHEDGQVVHRVVDAVVGHAGLGVVVGADLGGAVTRGDHGLALLGHLVEILLVLHVVDTGTQLGQSLVKVLELGLLVLALHHYAGRDVGQTDGRVSGVHRLAARA